MRRFPYLSICIVATDVRNYLRAIVNEDQRLVDIYKHLDTLVLAELAIRAAETNHQMGRLSLSIEAIRLEIESLHAQVQMSMPSDVALSTYSGIVPS